MSDLRPAARFYLAALALAACSLAFAMLRWAPVGEDVRPVLVLTVALFMTVAYMFPLPFAFKTKLYLDTTVIVAAILLFDPGVAILVAGTGTLVAHLLRREPADQTLFNTSQVMLQAGAGALLVTAGGWDPNQPRFDDARLLLILLGAGAAMFLVNTTAVAIIVGLHAGTTLLRVWIASVIDLDRAEHLAHLAQLAIGLLTAALAGVYPWTTVLLWIPAFAVYRSLQRQTDARRQAEAALQGSEASLAEAQRIAHLGSWDWDLRTGLQIWSDEVFRIFGFAPQAFVPTYDSYFGVIHPADRTFVDRAIHDALVTGQHYSVDHHLQLPDGSERIVHAQGEVLHDDAGRPIRMVGTLHDITERKALEERLAYHDPLTNLPNRALFVDRVEHALARAERAAEGIAVLFLDLDRFKFINDSLGHEAGDRLLVAVADRLSGCVRSSDTVARLGGDEFTILLEEITQPGDATTVAARIISELTEPFVVGGHQVDVTASIGVALNTEKHHDAADLLRDADAALYQAKHLGKARYEVFDQTLGALTRERLTLEADLRRALERGEFRLMFQPTVALATGRIIGAEALVRWSHPQRGLISPAEFIPLAEETGLIVPLGRWVLAEACRHARSWQERTHGDAPQVSVNLSARQFQHPDLVAEVAAVLADTGLPPRLLTLEITESAVMDAAPANAATLCALKALGVRLAIDDFGTGYSSLSYLKRFPVDLLKIDRSFVAGLGRNAEDEAIVGAVLGLAHALGLGVVAEGVESVSQAGHLQALGCDLAQGYLFAAPLPSESADALLSGGPFIDPLGTLRPLAATTKLDLAALARAAAIA